METADDLPYIGRMPERGENELLATGDSGTGMTNGTIAGIMLAERVLGRGTPWDDLYDTRRILGDEWGPKVTLRKKAIAIAKPIVRAAKRSEIEDVAKLTYGEGAIVKRGLKPVAVARLEDGKLCAVSGICTHKGCTVKWNGAESSWDCACHGSRFAPTGEVLHGPVAKPLAPVDINELLDEREEKVKRQFG